MVNKVIIMLLFLFVIAGAYSYDRYIIDKGQAGPISKILDLANLAKYIEDPSVKIVVTHKTYQANLENYLKRLDVKRAEIEQQRSDMINRRQNLLKQFRSLNIDIQEMARPFQDAIVRERTDFLEANGELNTLGETLIDIRFNMEPESREVAFNEVKEGLMELITQVVNHPEQDIPRIEAMFQKIEDIISAENDVLLDDCDDITICLEERLDDLEQQLTIMIQRMVENPDRDLAALMDLTELFVKEVQLLSDSYESGERSLQENEGQMFSILKDIAVGLSKISGEELRNLLGLYSELEVEQELSLMQLDGSMELFIEQDEKHQQQLSRALEGLMANETYNREKIRTLISQTTTSRPSIVNEIKRRTNEINRASALQIKKKNTFLNQMGEALRIDWRKFAGNDQYAAEHMEFLQQYQDNIRAWAKNDQEDLQKDMRTKAKENSRALKILREKDRDRRAQR